MRSRPRGRVVAAEPNNAEYHQLRGWIAFEGGDVRSALDDFAKALDIEPDHWPSAVSRAAALAAQGELEPALSTLTNAIVAHPRRAALYLERAKLHARSSLHARAVADCERGLTVLAPGAETIQLEPDLLRLAVLAHTADGNDGPAETVLARLSRIEDVSPLRTHIQGMRTARRAP